MRFRRLAWRPEPVAFACCAADGADCVGRPATIAASTHCPAAWSRRSRRSPSSNSSAGECVHQSNRHRSAAEGLLIRARCHYHYRCRCHYRCRYHCRRRHPRLPRWRRGRRRRRESWRCWRAVVRADTCLGTASWDASPVIPSSVALLRPSPASTCCSFGASCGFCLPAVVDRPLRPYRAGPATAPRARQRERRPCRHAPVGRPSADRWPNRRPRRNDSSTSTTPVLGRSRFRGRRCCSNRFRRRFGHRRSRRRRSTDSAGCRRCCCSQSHLLVNPRSKGKSQF